MSEKVNLKTTNQQYCKVQEFVRNVILEPLTDYTHIAGWIYYSTNYHLMLILKRLIFIEANTRALRFSFASINILTSIYVFGLCASAYHNTAGCAKCGINFSFGEKSEMEKQKINK